MGFCAAREEGFGKVTGRKPIEEHPAYRILEGELGDMNREKEFLREKYERELREIRAKYRGRALEACRRAHESGLSAYGIGKLMKVTNGERRKALMREILGEEVAKRVAEEWFDPEPALVRGWLMRRKKQEGRIDVEGKPARVVEVIDPEGGVWEANVCHWGFNHGWNWWIDPTGRRMPSNTYRTEHIPAAVRYIAFGEKWLDEVEADKR